MANQVLCIGKSNRLGPHERITHIGGINDAGQRWRLTQAEAIRGIENKTWQFHVWVGYREVNIIVAVNQYGNKYIKTEIDGYEPENLLSLPECVV